MNSKDVTRIVQCPPKRLFRSTACPLDDSIRIDQKLSGAGDEGCVVGFAFCDQATIEVDQSFVSSGRPPGEPQQTVTGASGHGRRRCGADLVFAAVVVEWSQTGQGRGVLAADLTEFGSDIRMMSANAVRSPMPGMLSTRSRRFARSS